MDPESQPEQEQQEGGGGEGLHEQAARLDAGPPSGCRERLEKRLGPAEGRPQRQEEDGSRVDRVRPYFVFRAEVYRSLGFTLDCGSCPLLASAYYLHPQHFGAVIQKAKVAPAEMSKGRSIGPD